jgi:hypothetical protein
MSPIWLVVGLLAVVAVALVAAATSAFRRRAPFRGGATLLIGVLTLALAGSTGAAAWSLARFQALTRETTAATIRIEPTGPQRFSATVTLRDGTSRRFALAGDQVWVDAQIVKWHPWANALGLHTAYRLERIGGRYRSLDDERTAARTVDALHDDARPSDLVAWAGRRDWLRPLIDARYGSASYLAADAPATVEVRVSTSGLLMRERP